MSEGVEIEFLVRGAKIVACDVSGGRCHRCGKL